VLKGSIANISAYLSPSYVDSRDGSTWDWVLVHAALTNLPVVHLKPFVAGNGAGDDCYSLEVTNMEQVELAERVKMLEGELTKAQDAAKKDKETADQRIVTMEAALSGYQAKIHEMDVKSIIAALQGKGVHEAVKMPANRAFVPAVLGVVEPILMADISREKAVKLSVDGKSTGSISDVVLSIMNAVAAAGEGALLSLEPAGTQSHEKPATGAEKSPDEKKKSVDTYLKDRHLV
jgi:hypothetical protein